jgi:tetratricopeptide (TPR) repeat protein
MRAAIERAMLDLDRALALRPRLNAAFRQKILAYNAGSGTGGLLRRTLDEAIAACPSCFQVRVTYIYALRPRWGGSYEAMAAFAAEADAAAASNPKLRLLSGYVDRDVAERLRSEKRYDEALVAVERACTLGEHWEFLLARADIQAWRGELEAAFADFNRASELRPGEPDVLFHRAAGHQHARRWEAAGRDLLAGFRLDPVNSYGRRLLDKIVKGLVHEGWQHHKAGRREDALRVYDVAAALAPTSSEVQRWRSAVVTAGTGRDGVTIAQLEARVRRAPDDFRSHQQLDYALAKRGELDRVVVLWTKFLSRNPDHGPAHLERGGAFFHMRRYREARADAQKACELGVNEGCTRARQLAPR